MCALRNIVDVNNSSLMLSEDLLTPVTENNMPEIMKYAER